MSPHESQKLDGSRSSSRPLRECPKCGNMREREGGVELSPGKWRCRSCWHSFNMKRK